MAAAPQVTNDRELSDKDIPEFVRRCWQSYQDATSHIREAAKESRQMWLGGKHQWRAGEIASRIAANRPYITINRLKPACDQVENEARNSPPGPQAHPVGGGADKDGADILEGLIREYEYRSDAPRAYITALRYAANSNAGVFEMATEYAGERSLDQRIAIKEVEDPDMVFVDPDARMACREDAMWAGKIRVLSREKLIEEYGSKLKVLNRPLVERASGWMQSAVGWHGNQSTVNLWTGGASSDGPYYVCEFYRVRIEKVKWALYSDNIGRYEDEPRPRGVTVKLDSDGEPMERTEGRRRVIKYVVTALDTIDKTEWLGTICPFFWVMGPEIYISGKLYRLSLIDGAADSQRGLNYTATAATEVVSSMTKAPWVGWQGQFDVANAQGINPWESSNTQLWAYMEVKPVFAVDPSNMQSTLLPAPQRNTWEAPITRLLELATFFGEQIKAATSVFFDPSIQTAADAQSGEAIKALQSQTNIGTLNWQDNLHRAVALSYGQAARILPQIMSGPRVQTIVRADGKHEIAEINQEFPAGEMREGKKRKANKITLGEYSLRVTAAGSGHTRTEKAIDAVINFLKVNPQIAANPAAAAMILRWIGEGTPEIEQLADLIGGNAAGATPEQLQGQLAQMQQKDQAQMALIQKMQQALLAKLPEIEAKKWVAELESLTKLRVAEITASKDADRGDAEREASHLESVLGMAHDTAMQAAEHEHAAGMQTDQQQGALQQQQQAADLQPPTEGE